MFQTGEGVPAWEFCLNSAGGCGCSFLRATTLCVDSRFVAAERFWKNWDHRDPCGRPCTVNASVGVDLYVRNAHWGWARTSGESVNICRQFILCSQP